MSEYRATPPNDVILGLDLGQSRDYTALSVTEVRTDFARRTTLYLTRTLDRWQPPRYQQVVDRVAAMVPKLTVGVLVDSPNGTGITLMRPRVTLVLDRTGVGRAVGDMFAEASLPVDLQLVTITSGSEVNRDPDGGWKVPKKDLVADVAVAMQNGRFEVVEQLEHAATLRREMQNFRARYSLAGNQTFAAGDDWRQGNHDDLVLAVALSLWWGEHTASRGGEVIAESYANVGAQDRAGAIDALWEAGWPTPYSRR